MKELDNKLEEYIEIDEKELALEQEFRYVLPPLINENEHDDPMC
jgi:hypothetical protein